jgi:hypothetical protein
MMRYINSGLIFGVILASTVHNEQLRVQLFLMLQAHEWFWSMIA